MTPTEQDKELRERIGELIREAHASGYILGTWAHPNIPGDNSREPSNPEDITEQTLELITADRKRVELETRVDELEKFVNTTNRSLSVKKLRDRLSELKAQLEDK